MAKKTKKVEDKSIKKDVNVSDEVVNENAAEETNETPEETVVDETATEETNEVPEETLTEESNETPEEFVTGETNEVPEETVTEEEPQPVRRQRITLEWNGMLYDY